MDSNQPDNVVQVDFSRRVQRAPAPALHLEKREIFTQFLEAGIVSVVLDPRLPLVQVPPHFRDDAKLVLNFAIGYRLPDFTVDDDGVGATLSFPQGYFYCYLPWSAVLAMHSDMMEKSAYFDSLPVD